MSIHIPASKDTLFMRGFNYRQDIDQIREFFASKCGRNTVEFFKEDGKDQLFLALKFESKDVARDVLERYNETDILGDHVSMTWYKDLRRARPYNDYRRQSYRVNYGDSYDHRGGYQGRSSYQRQGGRYRTASNGGRARRYSRSLSKSRSGTESGSLSQSRSKSSSCSRDSREMKKKRRDQSDSGSNRRRTIKKRHMAKTLSKESELQHEGQQHEGRHPRGPRSPPPIKNISALETSENLTSVSPQRKEKQSKQALQNKILTATLELEQQQQQNQQQQISSENQAMDVDGDEYGYNVSPKQQVNKQSNKAVKSSVQKRVITDENANSSDNNQNNSVSNTGLIKKDSDAANGKQSNEWIPISGNVPDNNVGSLNSSLTRKQQLQQQLQLVLNREQQQQQQLQQSAATTSAPVSASSAVSGCGAAMKAEPTTVSYDIGSYYKKYSNMYKKDKQEVDTEYNQDADLANKLDANSNNTATSQHQQQQIQHSKQQNLKNDVANSFTNATKDIPNDMHDRNHSRQPKDYVMANNDDDIADVNLESNISMHNKLARQARKRKHNMQIKDVYKAPDAKTIMRDDDDEDDDDGGAIENDYSDGDKHSYSRYDGYNDETKSKKTSSRQQRQDDRKQQKRDYVDHQMTPNVEKMNGGHPGKMSLLGLSQEKMLLIKDKKEEVEKAYRQDCETFATVTKLLISKDPLLEERIQKSLRENLRDIGHRCVQELREFVDHVKNNDVEDVGDIVSRGIRDISDF